MSKHRYYALPLNLETAVKKQKLATCSIEESISHQIHLMITTHFDENKYDPKFGNSIWDNEFGNLSQDSGFREHIKHSVYEGITRYEPRLEDVRVEIRWSQEETVGNQVKRLNERIDIEITGHIKSSRKAFHHNEQFYIAPLAYN